MQINEKKFKEILEDIVSTLTFAYDDTANRYVYKARTKLEVLLDLLEFEEDDDAQ